MVLLAPPGAAVPDYFNRIDFNLDKHSRTLRYLQRFRGSVYFRDGAVTPSDLAGDGSHETPEDERSWHLLLLDAHDRIVACAWYLDHDNRVHFDRLRLRHSPLATSRTWQVPLWAAVSAEIAQAQSLGVRYAEVGGWAVDCAARHTCDGLVVALAAYCLGRVRGETLGITTATARHGSSNILCRLGGRPLEADGTTLPPYFDRRYGCMMEILRFDSRRPAPQFERAVDRLHKRLAAVPVIARPYWPMPTRPSVDVPRLPTWDVGAPASNYKSVQIAP
jgi:hypothetical protein